MPTYKPKQHKKRKYDKSSYNERHLLYIIHLSILTKTHFPKSSLIPSLILNSASGHHQRQNILIIIIIYEYKSSNTTTSKETKTNTINESCKNKEKKRYHTTNLPPQTSLYKYSNLFVPRDVGTFYLIVRKRNDALYCI